MNTQMKRISPLCSALRAAGLARVGAALVLALGAAQAGAVTYTVPLTFNITLAAPTCSLTVGGVTANATTPTPAAGVTVDLTPTPIVATGTPNAILTAMSGLTVFSADAAGLTSPSYTVQRRLTTPPTATANCTVGTPMTARITKASSATNASPNTSVMAGSPGAGQSGTLPIGMVMGIASFAGTNGTTGSGTTTWGSAAPTVAGTATGADQAMALTVALYANSTTALTASQAGLWTYAFNVNLDF